MVTKKRAHKIITSIHRPDGLATIWIESKPQMTYHQAVKRAREFGVDAAMICKDEIAVVINEQAHALTYGVDDKLRIVSEPRVIELIVQPKCKEEVANEIKKNLKDKVKVEHHFGRRAHWKNGH